MCVYRSCHVDTDSVILTIYFCAIINFDVHFVLGTQLCVLIKSVFLKAINKIEMQLAEN